MGAAEILLMLLVAAFVAPVAWVVAHAVHAVCHEPQPCSPCAPQRYDSLTASVPQARRRMVEPVPPPFTFDTRPRRVPAQTHVSITPAPAPQRPRQAVPVVVPMAVPDLAPIAVEDWPIRHTVEQPEAVPVAINRTAARFAALEL